VWVAAGHGSVPCLHGDGISLGGMFFLDRSSSVHGSCVGESLFTLCNGRQAPSMAVVDWCYCYHTVNGRRRIFPHAVFFERSAYVVEQDIFEPLLFVFSGPRGTWAVDARPRIFSTASCFAWLCMYSSYHLFWQTVVGGRTYILTTPILDTNFNFRRLQKSICPHV
jgi:hypothetical protein